MLKGALPCGHRMDMWGRAFIASAWPLRHQGCDAPLGDAQYIPTPPLSNTTAAGREHRGDPGASV